MIFNNAFIGPPLGSFDHNSVLLFGKEFNNCSSRLVKAWDFRESHMDDFQYLCQLQTSTLFLLIIILLMKCAVYFIIIYKLLCHLFHQVLC